MPSASVISALLRRDYLIVRSYRLALTLDFALGLLSLLVYFFISRTFRGSSTADLRGAPDYFAFAAVGMSASVVIQAALGAVGQRLREEQLVGTLEALVAQPVRSVELSFGLAAFPFALAALRIPLYLSVAALWLGLDVSGTSWFGLAAMLAATALAFSTVGILTAALVLLWKRGGVVAEVAAFGMSFLGGAFFPVQVLPDWLQPLAKIVPTRFVFDGLRSALFEGSGWISSALVLFATAAAGLPVAVWCFERSLLIAQRAGSLHQY